LNLMQTNRQERKISVEIMRKKIAIPSTAI